MYLLMHRYRYMIMNNYHITDLVIGYTSTHACLITDIQCIIVSSLSNYLPIPSLVC